MTGYDLIRERQSVRNYENKKVDKETITKVIDLAKFAPSWGNTQIVRYTLIENRLLIEKIGALAVNGFSYNTKTLSKAPSLIVLSYLKGKSGKIENVEESDMDWVAFDVGIACQTFCLAAKNYGVATCIMGIIDQKIISQLIDLDEDQSIGAIITVGYQSGVANSPGRIDTKELIKYID